MILKKMVAIFDNLEDFNTYHDMYKDTDWIFLADHVYIHPFKEGYIHTYVIIHVKEVEQGEKSDN